MADDDIPDLDKDKKKKDQWPSLSSIFGGQKDAPVGSAEDASQVSSAAAAGQDVSVSSGAAQSTQEAQQGASAEAGKGKDALPPSLKDFQKTRIKLQGAGPRTLMERLKNFRKKDLMFILAGLAVLAGAPLAQRLLMGPQPNGGIEQGWDFKNGLGGFGSGGSPYEPGVNGLAPGQAANGNGDIITPFNSRDPASLILSPDAESQPAVGAPASSSDNGGDNGGQAPWKNVLANAGGAAGSAATQAAGLPSGPPALGDGFLGGRAPEAATSASYSPPSIANAPNRAADNGSLSQVKGNGVTGAGAPYSMTGQSGTDEALKNAAGQQSGYFNQPGSAGKGLEQAAEVNTNPTGGGEGDMGSGAGTGESDKATGQDSSKDSKSAGESLAEKAAEQNQQHAIDLYWKKLEAEQMFPITEAQKIEGELIEEPFDAIKKAVGKGMDGLFGLGDNDTYTCWVTDENGNVKNWALTMGQSFKACSDDNSTNCVSNGLLCTQGPNTVSGGEKDQKNSNCEVANQGHTFCTAQKKPDGKSNSNSNSTAAQEAPPVPPAVSNSANDVARDLTQVCTAAQAADSGNTEMKATGDKLLGGSAGSEGPLRLIAESVSNLSGATIPGCVDAAPADYAQKDLGDAAVSLKKALNEDLSVVSNNDSNATQVVVKALMSPAGIDQLAQKLPGAAPDNAGDLEQKVKDYWTSAGPNVSQQSGAVTKELNDATDIQGKASGAITAAQSSLVKAEKFIKAASAQPDSVAGNVNTIITAINGNPVWQTHGSGIVKELNQVTADYPNLWNNINAEDQDLNTHKGTLDQLSQKASQVTQAAQKALTPPSAPGKITLPYGGDKEFVTFMDNEVKNTLPKLDQEAEPNKSNDIASELKGNIGPACSAESQAQDSVIGVDPSGKASTSDPNTENGFAQAVANEQNSEGADANFTGAAPGSQTPPSQTAQTRDGIPLPQTSQ